MFGDIVTTSAKLDAHFANYATGLTRSLSFLTVNRLLWPTFHIALGDTEHFRNAFTGEPSFIATYRTPEGGEHRLSVTIIDHIPHAQNVWQSTGLYVHNKVYVNFQRTMLPTATKSRIWSYPQYKVDKTACGVVAHEVGHHVAALLWRENIHPDWLEVLKREKPMSGYEPTPGEAFAEAMRLYITNPDLLFCGRPMRYNFFDMVLRLRPVDCTLWETVLKDAPQHIKEAALSFAKKGMLI